MSFWEIAAANSNSFTVSIRLGDGLGGFSGTTNVSAGSNPVSVAIGDFNNDGKQDIAAANVSSNAVSIRLGNGLGGFSGTTNVSVGTSPESVAIGDFNNDGKQDIAAANANSNTVSIRSGDGAGSLSGTTDVSVGSQPYSVAIGDFNNDGKQDIATANTGSATVSILLGDGLGGFSGTTNVSVGSQPYSVAIGDFNNDGRQDFATANQNSNTVSIRLGFCGIAPTFTSANSTTFTAGTPGSFTVTATGNPQPTLSVSGTLPAGVTFTPATGQLSGTPGPNSGGTYNLTFTASNGFAPDATQNFTLTVLSPANVSGQKTVAGTFAPGSTVTYTVVLSNSGTSAQLDNPGNEFTDVLPAGLTLVSASATSGAATANIGTNTVSWNGSIAGSGSVTITITATINNAPDGTAISNQGMISFDADGNGTNESSRLTDDPSIGGASNPTTFTVGDVNDPPDAVNDSLTSVAEDSGVRTIPIASLLSNDTKGGANESGQTLTFSLVAGSGVGGTVTSDATNVYFTPAADYNGTASFQYTVTDNGTTNGSPDPKSDTGTVSFTVWEVNDAPIAVNDTLTGMAEDSGPRTVPSADLVGNDSQGAANESSQPLFVNVGNAVGGTCSWSMSVT